MTMFGMGLLTTIVSLICLFGILGTKGENRFGENPKTKPKLKVILGQD